MKIGVIGLGRMGGNIARRLMQHGHEVVAYDRSGDAVADVVPLMEEDSYMQDQIVPMIKLLNDGKVLAAAETSIGALN